MERKAQVVPTMPQGKPAKDVMMATTTEVYKDVVFAVGRSNEVSIVITAPDAMFANESSCFLEEHGELHGLPKAPGVYKADLVIQCHTWSGPEGMDFDVNVYIANLQTVEV